MSTLFNKRLEKEQAWTPPRKWNRVQLIKGNNKQPRQIVKGHGSEAKAKLDNYIDFSILA